MLKNFLNLDLGRTLLLLVEAEPLGPHHDGPVGAREDEAPVVHLDGERSQGEESRRYVSKSIEKL